MIKCADSWIVLLGSLCCLPVSTLCAKLSQAIDGMSGIDFLFKSDGSGYSKRGFMRYLSVTYRIWGLED